MLTGITSIKETTRFQKYRLHQTLSYQNKIWKYQNFLGKATSLYAIMLSDQWFGTKNYRKNWLKLLKTLNKK